MVDVDVVNVGVGVEARRYHDPVCVVYHVGT